MIFPTENTRSLILLVHSWDAAPSAIETLNQLMAFRRQNAEAQHLDEELLAIWFRPDLEANLPIWSSPERPFAASLRLDHAQDSPFTAGGRRGPAAGIGESFSLSGLWSLCWVDGVALRGTNSRQQRRRRILEALATHTESGLSSDQELFCPVVDSSEVPGTLPSILQELRQGYPHLVGDFGFYQDEDGGIVLPEGLAQPDANLELASNEARRRTSA